jgi:cysteine desulfurase/selenocysteine lyase
MTLCTERSGLDVQEVRRHFPLLRTRVHGQPLAYLDNAATTQKPDAVIDRLTTYYRSENANVHRGVHTLSQQATAIYEDARSTVQRFLHAAESREIVFVRGATEGINLVAQSYGRTHVGPGDEVLVSIMEHHSNIVPWQILCAEKGARLRVIPMTDSGEISLDVIDRLLGERTRVVSIVHVSNVLGVVNPVREIVRLAHRRGIPVLVDGAQAVAHLKVDVQALDCDFYVASGHKMLGPTGIGVLYGKSALLEAMPPYQSGGDMISSVTFERTSYNVLPYKFEAGTPDISGAVGLAAAIDFLTGLGLDAIEDWEGELVDYAATALGGVPGLRLIGPHAGDRTGVLSFVVEGVHPHDIGTIRIARGSRSVPDTTVVSR